MKTFKRSAAAAVLGAAVVAPVHAVQIDTDGKLVIRDDVGNFSARLLGQLHADANFYDSDVVDHDSGGFIRRARIGVSGHVDVWEYAIVFDNASDEADLKDAFVARKLGIGKLFIGQFKQFQGLEETTSSNETTFIERSHVSNSLRARAIGVGYSGTVDMFGFAGSVYNLREASDGGTRATDDGIGYNVRAYAAPFDRSDRALHLGASFGMEHSDSDGALGRVRPAGRSNEGRFVVYDASQGRADLRRLNLEAAGFLGPFSAQAEYLYGNAEDDVVDDDFQVAYVQGSVVVTGEKRGYDFKKGRIKNPRPERRMGAVELAARFQYAENDGSGDELTTIDLGANWYLGNNVRFMLNYSFTDNDSNGDESDLLSLRAQFSF